MSSAQTITTQGALKLVAQICRRDAELELTLQAASSKHFVMHWGLKRQKGEGWSLPPSSAWPPGTVPVTPTAVETPFPKANGQSNLVVRLSPVEEYTALEFVLFFPEERRWDNNGGRNYQIRLSDPLGLALAPLAALRARTASEGPVLERVFDLPAGGQVAAGVTTVGECYRVRWVCDRVDRLVLHWGTAENSQHEWLLPPERCRSAETTIYQHRAAETPFALEDGLSVLQLEFPKQNAPLGIPFVLREGSKGAWINNRGGNFYLAVLEHLSGSAPANAGPHSDLAEEIVRAEATHNSWTLMHRFNLCHDLLDRVRGNLEGQALIYVYLRFSSIRQLTWQRHYNTKPKELAHSQEHLTQKLTQLYRDEPASRPLVRLTLSTVGRGGDGQRIRDEILHIMHRHHVKEVSGHFLEEWHQKLHNNTTPDDMVICEAYLVFLQTNGSVDSFYQALEAGGVTRQRLQSFERPIRTQPDFVPHLKHGLIHDFENFLKILKSSHSGTDLETAINAARGPMEGGLQGLLNHLWEHRNDQGDRVMDLVRQITDARRRLSHEFKRGSGLRELLYLDLALEQLLRSAIERNIHLRLNGDQLVDLIAWVLENVTLSHEWPELAACLRHWERLKSVPRFSAPWSVHAKSVMDRVTRALSAWIDRLYQLLQPKAEFLGRGFQAELWTITLFSEEVVRGNSLGFVLSTLLRHLDPLLRQTARIGNWQIISRGRGAGQVEVVEALCSIQGKRFETPRIVVVDKVTGEEEIPEDVTAVIAPDVVDIVSHVAVRARNAHVLFASCHDPELLKHLKSLQGRHVQLEVTPAGDVVATEIAPETTSRMMLKQDRHLTVAARSFTHYAIPLDQFDVKLVGGKASHQARLRGRLPDWIRLPASAALPFGVFEKVLSLDLNTEVAKRYAGLVRETTNGGTEPLAELRAAVLCLAAPAELKAALREAMKAAGLLWPDDWETAWSRIKQVWASKWNERAFLSRCNIGLSHEALQMAVLIQEVVPADYAFVIHTVNPSNGDRDQLFGEVVLGLGEALVGNYPGRALSFVCHKSTLQQSVLSFPSKSLGLYGEGLIFRSDSNGEDLEGYAGAGLYDSVLLKVPRQVELEYTQQPLLWDEPFRQHLIATIARIGVEVEQASGTPQDIEGAVVADSYFVVQTRPQVGLP